MYCILSDLIVALMLEPCIAIASRPASISYNRTERNSSELGIRDGDKIKLDKTFFSTLSFCGTFWLVFPTSSFVVVATAAVIYVENQVVWNDSGVIHCNGDKDWREVDICFILLLRLSKWKTNFQS